MGEAFITRRGGGGVSAWEFEFKTSCEFPILYDGKIDIFAVGGGGGGAGDLWNDNPAGAGGTTSVKKNGTTILIQANGGQGAQKYYGGDGGSGGGGHGSGYSNWGAGGVDGADGQPGYSNRQGGKGQGTTTRAFEEPAGKLFSTGGDGGRGDSSMITGNSGAPNTGDGGDGGIGDIGAGGGGGGYTKTVKNITVKRGDFLTITVGAGGVGNNAAHNTGKGGDGGSGIVIIRGR